uniref:Uncharacterized protein TCIL3000_6_1390 n=1 Tax=Trypanosoma congolense (strain IL3000) TaxID=1068625 RepID=G0UNE7_TRYCI|nr:unnamed protein product [Trypanosoma congolense IL3000]
MEPPFRCFKVANKVVNKKKKKQVYTKASAPKELTGEEYRQTHVCQTPITQVQTQDTLFVRAIHGATHCPFQVHSVHTSSFFNYSRNSPRRGGHNLYPQQTNQKSTMQQIAKITIPPSHTHTHHWSEATRLRDERTIMTAQQQQNQNLSQMSQFEVEKKIDAMIKWLTVERLPNLHKSIFFLA